ncbi:FecR family protein [Membranihabitans marinus]|uniref:FecR family protein n=1 Tax=Membranihabitans marinus TaxID=1227546 RepID=UPI001F1EEB41|nr:FecR domain-containing protein [Membranihabitans marinus]
MSERGTNISKWIKYDLYDFIEDEEIRTNILHADESLAEWNQVRNILREKNPHFSHAEKILWDLQAYFNKMGISNQEIEEKINSRVIQYRQQSAKVNTKNKTIRIGVRSAAAVLVLVALLFVIKWSSRTHDVYQTGNGEQMLVELPDATKVHLNGNSRLVWNRNWKSDGFRQVALEGEGYFEVEKLKNIPFDVQADDVTIHVLGTVFNVNTRRQTTKVFLEEGKISLKVKDVIDEAMELKPGDNVEYNAIHKKLDKTEVVKVEELVGWKDGLLIYRQEPLKRVIEDVSDIYGKKFQWTDSSLLDRNITTTIPLSDWSMSAMAIQMAMNLDFEETNDTIIIKEKD